MRYLSPALSLIVAVVLIQDYVFTIVVSSLSGVDQLLSITNAYGIVWYFRVALGISLVTITWYLTIRGRGESAWVVFTALGIFVMLTLVMTIGLFYAKFTNYPAIVYPETLIPASLGRALYHMLTASMKGLVALSGLEAMSNGIQFVINEDAGIVIWGRSHLPPGRSRMKKALLQLASLKLAVILLVLLLVALAAGTIVESAKGREVAGQTVYYAWWFLALQAVFALNVHASIAIHYPWGSKRVGFLMTHGSLLLIFAGSCVSYFAKVEGHLPLWEGQTSGTVITQESEKAPEIPDELPFKVKLDDFQIDYYQGTMRPAQFRSLVQILDGSSAVAAKIY